MTQSAAELNGFSYVICLEASKCGKEKDHNCGNCENHKCIHVAGIIQIYQRKPCSVVNETFEDSLPLQEHSDRNKQQSEYKKSRQDDIYKEPQVGIRLVKDCRDDKKKKDKQKVDGCNYRTNYCQPVF